MDPRAGDIGHAGRDDEIDAGALQGPAQLSQAGGTQARRGGIRHDVGADPLSQLRGVLLAADHGDALDGLWRGRATDGDHAEAGVG